MASLTDSLRMLRRFAVPSRTLGRYMVRLYLTRFLGLLIGLTAILQILDLLAQGDDILNAEGASWYHVLSYVFLRLPQLLSQFTPFTALLAALLTLATLNQNSEITVMKAMGMSAHRILLPLGLACFVIALAHFYFNEYVLVRTNAQLEWWQENDYAANLPPAPVSNGKVWLKEGSELIFISKISRLELGNTTGQSTVLDGISIYEVTSNSRLSELARADFAVYQAGDWFLHGVRRFDTTTHQVVTTDIEEWKINLTPERLSLLKIKPAHTRFDTLYAAIRKLDDEGLPTAKLMTSFLQKFAGPASSILMPLLAAIAAFGISRRGTLMLRIIAGMALGFSFFVADNFMLAMGEFGVAPPLLAAWAPFFLFMILGYAVIFTTEEGSGRARRKHLSKKATA